MVAYGVAGLVGGAFAINRGWAPPEAGVRVWVEDNGIHTSIIVPVAAEGVDWRDLVRPEEGFVHRDLCGVDRARAKKDRVERAEGGGVSVSGSFSLFRG